MTTPPTPHELDSAAPLVHAPYRAAFELLSDPLAFVAGSQQRYGDLFVVRFGLTRALFVNHPSHIDRVLRVNGQNYSKEGAVWDSLRTLFGDPISIAEGEVWRKRRRQMQPHFRRDRTLALVDQMSHTIEEIVERWAARIDGPVPVHVWVPEIALTVIIRAICGTSISDEDIAVVRDSLGYAVDHMVRQIFMDGAPAWLPVPGRARYAACLRDMHEVVDRVIAARRGGGGGGDDILGMLLESRDEEGEKVWSDEELRSEVVGLIVAGHDTTANGLSWLFYELARRPEIADRIREEVTRVVGEDRPGGAHVRRLVYARSVFKEALRRYPPAWMITRQAREDDVIDGRRVPAGTMLLLSFYGCHHHPAYWPDADRFDPERFRPEAERQRPKEAWVPFSGGTRKCLGEELSLMEASLILAHVLTRYDLSLIPGREPRPKLTLGMTSEDGIWLDLAPREGL